MFYYLLYVIKIGVVKKHNLFKDYMKIWKGDELWYVCMIQNLSYKDQS